MGYRSDVAYSTTKEGFDFFLERVRQHNADSGIDYPLIRFDDAGEPTGLFFTVHDSSEFGVVFGFDNVKWYESYVDVQIIEESVNELDAAGYPWMFVRIGEDNDDDEIVTGNDPYGTEIPRLEIRRGIYWFN